MNTLKQDDNNLIPLNIDGKEYSAILSGLNSKVFRSVDITALQNEPGWIFDDEERMEPWNLIGISEHRGCMVFYGPLVEGREFTSADLDLEKLNRMVHLFQALRNKKMSYQGFYSRGWIFLNDGRILLLPNSLMEFIRKSDNEKTRMLHWYPYNHPDHSGLKGLEFTAAILSATLLKGQHPYAPWKLKRITGTNNCAGAPSSVRTC
ncbi:hypothetical protein EXM22_10480 [Oceanispirochaeta crateris]|uniref:Uncharacterized protein n=1 Tax=Oceanispirochaeta crateris TaxID=2518645 RepID=A0A5C1QLM6_9SPIO|nr:hypothetical protein [Oceanispirochaeta crateris]QEN08387.1 hypothetical protein EXM22_10480 [Oceanispirochaeta crateris]